MSMMKFETRYYTQTNGGDDDTHIVVVEAETADEAVQKCLDIILSPNEESTEFARQDDWDSFCYSIDHIDVRPYSESVEYKMENIVGAEEKFLKAQQVEDERRAKNSIAYKRKQLERLKKELGE